MIAIKFIFILINILFIGTIETKDFTVYWNIPTFMCKSFGLDFSNLTAEYGVTQNTGDTFRGDKIAILYDPGKFPAILEQSQTGKKFRRNGGVPQEGDLSDHLAVFSKHVDELIPDKNFNGVAVIDFESWRPIYRQNFGTLKIYQDLSMQIEQQNHFLWPKNRLEIEATKRFEESGRQFMEQTLLLAKELRPAAQWGYYAFPYCFNMNGGANMREDCASNVVGENNRVFWLFDSSDIIMPSVYMNSKINSDQRHKLVKGRVREAMRIKNRVKFSKPTILTYVRYVYTDTRAFLSEVDMYNAITSIRQLGGDGVILWGSSSDLNTKEKCQNFLKYLDTTMGPIVQSVQPRYYVEQISISLD